MKKTLVADTVTELYTSVHGTNGKFTQLEFRIDPDAADTVVLRYATGKEAAATVRDDAANPSDEWMPLLLNEVHSDDKMITGEYYYVVASANVDVYFAVTGAP